ncbi:Histidine kinase 2 [Acorus calamus]|uniref:histidine kinase n=1 Tax=Acorus calamus TaxID=4465 RepID=A0AAV9E3D3_ACOCL|nr:Histidine kinase 2 [Acorus calamus]
MSFSAIISSVFAKLPRFFLRIHKWFFARMTLNSKVSDGNNNEGFTDDLRVGKRSCGHRKSLRVLLCLLFSVIGIVWFSLEATYGGLMCKVKVTHALEEDCPAMDEQFNISKKQLHILASLISSSDQRIFTECMQRSALKRPLSNGLTYAWGLLHSGGRHDEEKQNLEDRENILRARASGKGVLTSPFKLLKSNRLGVVLTFAVYNIDLPPNATPEQRINATKGYLGASFDVPSLVEKLLQQLASKQTIVVNVYDTTNASAPINMYGPNVTENGLSHVSNLDFGDPNRKHEMHCRFKQKAPIHWSAITTSSGVLVIILLVGHIFYAAVNRIAKVEDDYREMRELKGRAEAADIAKSRFLATVSHEIRTPMNGVLGMLQMLMDTDLDATQQDYAMTAQASGKSLIALINEVLDQAKIESGRLELEAVPFDPRSILDNVLSLFSGKSQDKGVELAGYTSDQVPDVLIGDPGRFRQIITNLVGNSVKFTEEGHIFVSVHLAEDMKGSTDAELHVNNMVDKDAWGKGMGVAFLHRLKEVSQNHISKPVEHFPKVFLLATSISPTEVNELESARLVDNVMMKPLRLSMISACLQKALGVGTKKSLERRQPSMLKSLLNGKQMLVVDDNSVNRRVAAGALKKYGAIVTCADSGKVAVEMLCPPHKFDACFMDVQMPEMDGFEATRQIRCMEAEVNGQIKSGKASEEMYENVGYWHIPILAMTADVIQATHEECLRFGMDDYVSKPFEEEQLYSAVAHFFESDKGESTY